MSINRKPPLSTGNVFMVGTVVVVLLLSLGSLLRTTPYGDQPCTILDQPGEKVDLSSCQMDNTRLQEQVDSAISHSDVSVVDLGHNHLSTIPASLCTSAFPNVEILNLERNHLHELPTSLAGCTGLRHLGLKKNLITSIPTGIFTQLTSLAGLYLTDNRLSSFPDDIGQLRNLRKLQASRNRLSTLPDSFYRLPELELARFAVNKFNAESITSAALASFPKLAWTSFGGNSFPKVHFKLHPPIPFDQILIKELLGEGASGTVYRGLYKNTDVAVKIFKGNSPDGNPWDEITTTILLPRHANIVQMIGRTEKDGNPALVLELIDGQPLAKPPNMASLLRCRYDQSQRFKPAAVLKILLGLLSALKELHAQGISHGDVYAHNIFLSADGTPVLSDFGSGFFAPSLEPSAELVELRAVGILAQELYVRMQPHEPRLKAAISALITNSREGTSTFEREESLLKATAQAMASESVSRS